MPSKRKHELSEERRILIRLLAHVDCLFWPTRDKHSLRADQVRNERRRAYAQAGLDFAGGGGEAARQTLVRRLKELADAGLIEITRAAGRREGIRFTLLGDAITRTLCAVHTVASAWPLLVKIGDVDRAFDGAWPEHLAIGVDEWTGTKEQNEALQMMRQTLVPLLPIGYVSCAGDTASPRRYWMRLEAAGRRALEAGADDVQVPEGIQSDEQCAELYDREWAAYAAKLQSARPDNPNDLQIPIPSGVGWGSLAALINMHAKKEPAA
jgi:hypothetical protein